MEVGKGGGGGASSDLEGRNGNIVPEAAVGSPLNILRAGGDQWRSVEPGEDLAVEGQISRPQR